MKPSILVTAVLLSAPTVARPQDAADPCALVSAGDVQQILGVPLGPPEKKPGLATPFATFANCSYATSDGTKSLTIRSRVSKGPDGGVGPARQAAVSAGVKVEDVPGLGDGAFWTGKQLQAFRGPNVQIAISTQGIDGAKDKAIAVARKALTKP